MVGRHTPKIELRMSPSITYALAALMVVVGFGFIYILVRPNARPVPQGAVQWTGTLMSGVLIALGVALGVLTYQIEQQAQVELTPPVAGSETVDLPAENFTFTLLDSGEEVALTDYRGQVVLLNFWATWCPPCLTELPALNRLQREYGDDGLVVVTISDEDPATIRDFAEEEIELHTVSGFVTAPEELPQPFVQMLAGRPMSYIVDREGRVRQVILGERDFAAFETMVVPLLQRDELTDARVEDGR